MVYWPRLMGLWLCVQWLKKVVYSSLSFCFPRFRAVYFLALYAGKRLELMQFDSWRFD